MDSELAQMHRQKKVPKRQLMLHFDINSTILMKDSQHSTKSVQFSIARSLAKSAWGKIVQPEPVEGEEESKPAEWKLMNDAPSWSSPAPNDPEVVEYVDYLRSIFPKGGDNKKEMEDKRIEYIRKFTEDGQPGEKFQVLLSKLMRLMEMPENARNEIGLSEDLVEKVRQGLPLWEDPVVDDESQGDDEEDLDDDQEGGNRRKKNELSDDEKKTRICYGEGMYFIAPSFYRTLMYLKKQGRLFNVSFRSFGTDIEDVKWEFNNFCEGKHPCFNGKNGMPLVKFNGENGTPDLRFRNPGQEAINYRVTDELEQSKMVVGMSNRLHTDYKEAAVLMNQEHQYQSCTLLTSIYDQYRHVQDTLNKYGTMAISDDYQGWKENDFHRECAKLQLIDQGEQMVQHIFFDDNADEGENCIVDVRDIVTKEILPYKKQMGRYVVKCDPLKVIMEPDYLIRMIEQCEDNRDIELANLENGIMEDLEEMKDPEKVLESEWQKLQKLPNDEYLMKTILPVLYQGMQTLEQNRPVAPLEYLSIYLLQNQHKIKLPPKDDNFKVQMNDKIIKK